MLPPDKVPLPTDGVWHWRKRYFDVGDAIKFRNIGEQQDQHGIVTAIKMNNKGRVSYFVKDRFVLTEDVSRAARGTETSNTAP